MSGKIYSLRYKNWRTKLSDFNEISCAITYQSHMQMIKF